MWFNTPLSLRHGCDSFLFTIIITEEFLINNTTGDHIEPADNIIQQRLDHETWAELSNFSCPNNVFITQRSAMIQILTPI